MDKIDSITGTAVPIDASDVDTDQIIPAVWMKRVERTGFQDGLFAKWRRDPGFVLNQPERRGATILVAGPNFGCGSSREHAPWALRDYGFKAIIAPSFADIFRNNLPNIGLVPVTLDEASCRKVMAAVTADAATPVTVDLVARTVTCTAAGVVDVPFVIEENARYRLINGKDLIDLALDFDEQIRRHEERRPFWMPRTNGQVEPAFELSGVEQ
ncbi:3-isopropylmalate dehydratase small subunit [Micromonospora mirobrigensis]|uniref:3-isopropylmalate dehydratase small subunit n=1 Tax=Micromonospora mirobrigensis TaxID=262898 RepID=A0A1C4V416_9ACTN|nr:3-isopropylmalate dehydratase small subunit [Micromonospora mirobrigensis]SCE78571.1 3-isopropylmalate/(R)-2-methylmalate dehydratase small subunit [Micromonospora mirobrigensis]